MKNLLFIILISLHHSALASIKLDLQLAKNYINQPVNIKDYWLSEKLDGIRGYWNGQTLFTKQGNIINSPHWFTAHWPKMAMEGELWIARGAFEQTLSCVMKKSSAELELCWQAVKFMVFDLPKNTKIFTERIKVMHLITTNTNSTYLQMIPQYKVNNINEMYQHLDKISEQNGEGLMLHKGSAIYKAGRTNAILKVKKRHDAEALVLKHLPGKGKYVGMLGAIQVKNNEGVVFNIGSGFSDKDRATPPPIGSIITYQYLGKTKNNIPRFASFLRRRN